MLNSATVTRDQPHFGWLTASRARTALWLIIVASVALRLFSALYQGNSVGVLPGIYDQVSYDGLARRLVQGFGFSFAEGHWPATRANEPTAHWSYLYTIYLAGVYLLSGFQPLIARVLQAVIVGILHPWLAWRLGKRIFGPAAGLLAAAFSAIYIYFFYYTGALITESFYIVSLLWSLDICLRIAASSGPATGTRSLRWRLWVELGVAIAVATLLRQLFLLVTPLLFLWLWWMLSRPAARMPAAEVRRTRLARFLGTRTLAGFFVTIAIVAAAIVPWTVRNYLAFGMLVPLNTNAGYVFYWANHPIYGTEFIGILPADGPSYADLLPPELLDMNEAALDQALLRRGLGFVADDPGRYVLLSISRAREYFKFWPSSDSSTISNLSRVGSFGLFLPFMLFGVILAVMRIRRRDSGLNRSGVVLLVIFMVAYTAMHLLTWTLIRYRLPVDAVLLLFAGYGVTDLAVRVYARREPASAARHEALSSSGR